MVMPVETALSGYELLHNPRLNRGTAFTEAERRAHRLEGLLPPRVSPLELQVARTHEELGNLDNDLQKYVLLSDLQARNETLFYAVLMSDPATFMPLVYTPTVGEACQKFDHIFRATRGVYLPITARGRLKSLLANWPQRDVRFIVVTDGERILGLGDQGVGGMGIPIGKLALYTACAGVPPQYSLPVMLDVGTNNHQLLEDPLYLGLEQTRVRGEEYHAFIDEFVEAVQALYPKCCIQWEDFANINAVPILERYRDKICTYNDDIQGTAAVALAGIFAALRISGQKLTDQRFLFLGGGSAATGIAELISEAMTLEGLSLDAARARNALFDINGLVVKSRTDLGLSETVRAGPCAYLEIRRCGKGTEADRRHRRQHRAEALQPASHRSDGRNQRSADHLPVFEPYLAFGMHRGRSLPLVARPRHFCERQSLSARRDRRQQIRAGQGNNVYIFPAMGMAVFATQATRVTEEMFIVAAKAVAEQVTDKDLAVGLIYPPQAKILESSLHVATSVAGYIFDKKLARVPRPKDIGAHIRETAFAPVYRAE
jgi:malate dehydrogenase (oxaloacetate-decarboxylating)(NADP+)